MLYVNLIVLYSPTSEDTSQVKVWETPNKKIVNKNSEQYNPHQLLPNTLCYIDANRFKLTVQEFILSLGNL